MPQELEELALFPLLTVLFPFASMRLNIFEDRYREMIRTCLREDRPFGVVLIRSGEEVGEHPDPYLVGTVARIEEVQTYDDGRMDIQVQGERRFRIRELNDSGAYLVGRVEPVIEQSIVEDERGERLISDAREQFEALIQRYFARQEFNVQVVFPEDPVAMTFTIANLLEVDDLEKQKMLETTDTLERLEELLSVLQVKLLETRVDEPDQSPDAYRVRSENLSGWISPN